MFPQQSKVSSVQPTCSLNFQIDSKVFFEAMFTFTVLQILLFEGRYYDPHSQSVTVSERGKRKFHLSRYAALGNTKEQKWFETFYFFKLSLASLNLAKDANRSNFQISIQISTVTFK